MGWFRREPGRFQTAEEYRRNLETQLALTPKTLAELRKLGVTKDRKFKLEYFFYTNAEAKAGALSRALTELGYEGDFGRAAKDRHKFIINGWTTSMRMDDATVLAWTRRMCELGESTDCDFDGWGTNPNQDGVE